MKYPVCLARKDYLFSVSVWILLKVSCNFKSIIQIKLYLLVLGMPKFRKESTNRGEWTNESMIRAVKLALEKNSSVRKISEACNVPRSTLQDKIYNIKQGLKVSMSSKLGGFECTFTDAYGKKLVDYMIDLDNRLMPLSRKQFLKLAFNLAESLKIPHKFSKTRQAGKDFYYGFVRRHPELSLRKPESTNLTRAVGFNKPQVERFFQNTKSFIRNIVSNISKFSIVTKQA